QHLRLSLFLRTLVSALCPYTTLFRSWSCTSTRGLPLLKNLWLWKNHRFQNQPSSGFAKRFLPAHPAKPPLGQAPQSAQSAQLGPDRKSTRLNSSHVSISYAVFCLKKK